MSAKPLNAKDFVCYICGTTFHSKMSNYKRHLKNFHNISDEEPHNNIRCLELSCVYACSKLNDLGSHLHNKHQLLQEMEELHFPHIEDFERWKAAEEEKSQYHWVKQYGRSGPETNKISVFYCNRSGKKRIIDDDQRKKVGKSQGSCKTDSTCTSSIVVTEKTETINVKFYKTHYGHDINLAHIPLPTSSKQTIAAQLLLGVPSTRILDKIRESVDDGFKRIHLTTTKDINNIAECFHVHNKMIKDQNDATSIRLWVNDMRTSDDNCILLYKEQYTKSNLNGIRDEDFLLGIMAKTQESLLKQFGDRGIICMDATHGTNPYDFNLIMILTVDDFGEGFPIAFLFSNREDYVVLKHFILAIKERVGVIIASVFMSDDADQYFSAWNSVMNSTGTKKLLCAWHVDKAWRNKIHLIRNKEKQEQVYKMLCIIRQEPDQDKFRALLESLCNFFRSDQELAEFDQYFTKYYIDRTPSWATCYRIGCGVNTNMHLEAMHKVLKHIYLQGTVCKRLDKTVFLLQKFIRGKQFERVIKLTKGKSSSKLCDSNKRHMIAVQDDKMCYSIVTENEWSVTSNNITYTVFKNSLLEHKCNLTCSMCGACTHVFKCTCMDYIIKGNICKHIHKICIQIKNYASRGEYQHSAENNTEIEIDMHLKSLKNIEGKDIDKIKNSIRNKLCNISLRLENLENPDLLKKMNTQLNCIENLISSECDTMKSFVGSDFDKNINQIPVNKKIERQIRFSSTKKRRKINSGLAKPTVEEKISIEQELLNIQ